jgi:hypothetical protein
MAPNVLQVLVALGWLALIGLVVLYVALWLADRQ